MEQGVKSSVLLLCVSSLAFVISFGVRLVRPFLRFCRVVLVPLSGYSCQFTVNQREHNSTFGISVYLHAFECARVYQPLCDMIDWVE